MHDARGPPAGRTQARRRPGAGETRVGRRRDAAAGETRFARVLDVVFDKLFLGSTVCTTVNITLDYEKPVGVSRQDSTESASPHEFFEHPKAAPVPLLLQELERRFSGENTEILGAFEGLDSSKSTYLDMRPLSRLTEKFGICLNIDSD